MEQLEKKYVYVLRGVGAPKYYFGPEIKKSIEKLLILAIGSSTMYVKRWATEIQLCPQNLYGNQGSSNNEIGVFKCRQEDPSKYGIEKIVTATVVKG